MEMKKKLMQGEIERLRARVCMLEKDLNTALNGMCRMTSHSESIEAQLKRVRDRVNFIEEGHYE